LHWIDVNKYERKYAGPITESNVAGPTGALWIQDKHIHYIDQDGDERILNGQ